MDNSIVFQEIQVVVDILAIKPSPHSCTQNRQTFQLNRNRSRQRIHADSRPARLIVFEIFRVNAVEGVKIALHIHEENGHVHKVFPTRAAVFENDSHVLKNGMHLFFKIKLEVVA